MDIIELLQEVLNNIKQSVSINSIIGTPMSKGEFTVIPVSKMTMGFASVGGDLDSKNALKNRENPIGGVGGGATVFPMGFLIISDEKVSFINTEKGEKLNECIENVLEFFSK